MIRVFTRFWKLNNAKLLVTMLCIALMNSLAFAQDQQISGKVVDETGAGLPGASVLIKGTSTGTVTDMDGNYSLSAGSSDVLVISFIGYLTTEVTVGGRSTVDVSLELDAEQLEEVVVTGYSSQRKRDITGAVTVVDSDELNTFKAPSFAQKLNGRATGVTISQSGAPGGDTNIRIRGITSFGSSDPLIIIDGIQVQGDKAMTGLNPNDIESMQILKDASAATIYGARANAGVIVITTKQGKAGKVQVTYDGYVGTQSAVGGYNDFLIKNPEDYARVQVAKNPAMADFYSMADVNSDPTVPTYYWANGDDVTSATVNEGDYSYPDHLIMRSNQEGTDWWDEVFAPALITEHNIGLSGGTENATFSSSVGYMKQDGTMQQTYFDRLSLRLNSRFNAGKFKFGESMSIAMTESVDQPGGNQTEQNIMTQILKMNSIVPVRDVGGNWGGAKATGFSNGSNPVGQLYNNRNDTRENFRFLGNIFAEVEVVEGLTLKTSYSMDFSNNFSHDTGFPTFENREVNSSNFYSEMQQRRMNWTWTNTIQYAKTFADVHAVKVLAGYEAVQNDFRQINGQVNDLVSMNELATYLNLTYSTFNNLSSQQRINTMASVFGQLNYEYDDKYLISATVRRDGSSEFLEDERFGVFPAVSLGWRVSSESFMEGVSFINDFKIRAGYGVTGNQNIPVAYNAYNQYGGRSAFDAGYAIDGGNTSASRGFTLFRYGNPAIKWEENVSTNIGLDATFMDGKLGLVFDVYQKKVTDLIFNPVFPGSAGNASASYRNVASMDNNGWELGLSYKGEISSDLGFNLALNVSQYRNKIVKLDGEQDQIFPAGIDKRFGEVNVWQVGDPISSFYGYTNDGMFQSQTEIDNLNDQAEDATGVDGAEYQAGALVGAFKRKDINGDGQITSADQGVIGNPHPDVTLGLNIGLDYKNFDFSMFLFASIGNDIYNYNRLFTHFGQFASNVSKDVLTDSWTPTNTGASIPQLNANDTFSQLSSDFYVEDGSYLRAQNVTLGYTVPSGAIKGFQSLRIYVQAQNLFTITGYSGIDPALSNANIGATVDGQRQNDGWTGFDLGNYPSSRVFMFGVNASF